MEAELSPGEKDADLGEVSHLVLALPTCGHRTYTWPIMRQAEVNHHASVEAHLPIPCYLDTRPAAYLPTLPNTSTLILCSRVLSPPLGRRPTT